MVRVGRNCYQSHRSTVSAFGRRKICVWYFCYSVVRREKITTVHTGILTFFAVYKVQEVPVLTGKKGGRGGGEGEAK
jgi:hypothetical protein